MLNFPRQLRYIFHKNTAINCRKSLHGNQNIYCEGFAATVHSDYHQSSEKIRQNEEGKLGKSTNY